MNGSTTGAAKPALLRVIQADFVALIAVGFPLVGIGMYIIIAYFGFFPGFRGHDSIQGSEGAPFFLYLGLAGLAIGVPILILRMRSFQSMFTRGVEVQGRITDVSFQRDRGRVQYTYAYSGETYRGWNALMKTKRTKALEPGDDATLLVDPDNPKRALIRDLNI